MDETTFRATELTEGAWVAEQMHVAPAMGLLTHAIETDRDARRADRPVLTRLSFDILGALPVGEVDVQVRVLRPGRTIELVEASLRHDGRAALVVRAWLQQPYDTSAIAWSPLRDIPGPEGLGPLDPADGWPGLFAQSLQARAVEVDAGTGRFWLRTDVPLVAGEQISAVARAFTVIDVTNGMAPRVSSRVASYPNLDLTVHLFREPRDGWIGFDKTSAIGTGGVGITRSTLHDADGVFGTSEQILTVRMQDAPA